MNLGTRIASWWQSRQASWDDDRWLVLDVEASGLDAAHDRLLAIAAIAVRFSAGRAWIAPGDSFEVVLKQADDAARPDKANILLHGIGVGAQRAGVEPPEAMAAFAAFAGRSPLVAFHAAFDRTLIERGFRATLGASRPIPGSTWSRWPPCCIPMSRPARSTNGWRISASPARCATRPPPTRWPRPNCC